MKPTRRGFLGWGLVGLAAKAARPIAGTFVHDAFAQGHRLRDRPPFASPKRVERFPIVIVGGGIAGLSAAWRLNKRGFHDFVLLEMEPDPGGNARWGENEVSRYPWAAHYVPVPSLKNRLVRELFEDLGVLNGGVWDERMLCFSPQERLFLHGRWQEGIEPDLASTARDRDQYRRFNDAMNQFRDSGQFTIPMEAGARPSPLDSLSMEQWLEQNGYDSPYLNWYVNYACRDDYGARAHDISAWAGVQYFASREPEEKGPLTWPEGNGWIVERLLEGLRPFVRAPAMVYAIVRHGKGLGVQTERVEYAAERVIFAAPTFLAPYIVEGAPKADGFVYSPWLTANLTIDRLPGEPETEGSAEPAWDNVIYDSSALGYVDATHMSLRTFIERRVWTFYWSLADASPAEMRNLLLEKDWTYWRDAILQDLSRAHPDIRSCVSRIDVMRMGHAMARPVPGFLGSETRRRFASAPGPVLYANSDLSGFSIFEEAQYRGVTAAERALASIAGRRYD